MILERDELTRGMIGLPTLTPFQDEVTGLFETAGARIMVRTADSVRRIFVPVVLEGYEELRAGLSHWGEIGAAPGRPLSTRLWTLGLLALYGGPYAVVLCFMSLYAVLPAAAVLFGVSGWCMWRILRSPLLGAASKRVAWKMPLTLIPAAMKLAILFGFSWPQ